MNVLMLDPGAAGLKVAAIISLVAGVTAVCRASPADTIRSGDRSREP